MSRYVVICFMLPTTNFKKAANVNKNTNSATQDSGNKRSVPATEEYCSVFKFAIEDYYGMIFV